MAMGNNHLNQIDPDEGYVVDACATWVASSGLGANVAGAMAGGIAAQGVTDSWQSNNAVGNIETDVANTISKINVSFGESLSSSRQNTPKEGTPWLETGLKEYKSGPIVEMKDKGDNPTILKYIKSTKLEEKYWNDETAWCASFVNWCMKESGIEGAGALGWDWENWGVKVNSPIIGAVAIFNNGHVGIVLGMNGDKVKMLHGNWSNKLSLTDYTDKSEIKTYRYPSGYKPAN